MQSKYLHISVFPIEHLKVGFHKPQKILSSKELNVPLFAPCTEHKETLKLKQRKSFIPTFSSFLTKALERKKFLTMVPSETVLQL